MTISANSSREFNRGTILRRALQKAGLMTAGQNPSDTDPKVQQAADALEMVLDALQDGNVIITSQDFLLLTLVAGQGTYTLPVDTLDVIGTAMVIQSATAGELPVEPMGPDEWQRITDKTAVGVPRRYYVHKLMTPVLYLWPKVDTTAVGWTLRYRQERLLKDADSQNVTMDLRRSWTLYLVTAVAHQLAISAGMDIARCGYLRAEAKELKTAALGGNRARGPAQMHVQHRGPWR